MHRDGSPLQVGEMVRYDRYARSEVCGVIVARLTGDYLRVKWDDLSVPITHRSHTLKRALPSQRLWRQNFSGTPESWTPERSSLVA